MTTHITHQHLDSMAWTIDRHGIDAIPVAALRELGFEARSAGARAGLTELLVDPSAPGVVRQRAFGFIAVLLGRTGNDDGTKASPELITRDQVACAA